MVLLSYEFWHSRELQHIIQQLRKRDSDSVYFMMDMTEDAMFSSVAGKTSKTELKTEP
jgi:hypothetical protein